MQTDLYNQEGEKEGLVQLPERVFNVPWNADLVHQVVVSLMANKRRTIASTKDRSEVSGGGKKPWRQKHTGRARHGSVRSPLWRGGGVSHGPRKEKRFSQKVNQRMKKKATACVLSAKLKDNSLFILNDLKLNKSKTKEIDLVLKKFFSKVGVNILLENNKKNKKNSKSKVLLIVPSYDRSLGLAVRNLPYAFIEEARNMNIMDLMKHRMVLLLKDGIDIVSKLLASN